MIEFIYKEPGVNLPLCLPPHDPLFDSLQNGKQYFAEFMQIVQKAQSEKTAIREKIRELEQQEVN